MSRRAGVLGAVAVIAVVALGISNASAASLTVIAGKLGTFNVADRCATGPLAVAVAGTPGVGGTYTQVSIANVPAACDGKAIALTVFGAARNALGTSVLGAVAVTGPTTVIMGSYTGADVLGAALTIGGYGMSTTWTGPAGAANCVVTGVFPNGVPGTEVARTTETCSVTITVNSVDKGNGNNQNAQLMIVVTNNSTSVIRWRVDAHLAQVTPLLPFTPKDIATDVTLYSECSAMPDVIISGTSASLPDSQVLYPGGTATVTFFVYEKQQNRDTSC